MPERNDDTPRTRRRARRQAIRRRRLGLAGALVLVVAAVAGAVLALSGGGEKRAIRRVAEPSSTTTSSTLPAAPSVARFATTKVPKLAVYEQPNPGSKTITTLDAKTTYLAPTTLLIDSERVPFGGFVPVSVPLKKPNNTPGWVKRSDVAIAQTPYEIHVQLFSHTVELRKAGEVVLTSKVIIGTKDTPTPTGRFYVTDPVNCNTESVPGYPVGQCDGAYGAFAIGTSGLSEKLDSFAGTIPQIALHGTSLPATELGKDLSNGCIRMPNDVVLQLAKIKPLIGTPVIITLFGEHARGNRVTGSGDGSA